MPLQSTRRMFLAGAGTLALSPLAGSPNERLAIGLVGAGARMHQLIKALQKMEGVEIVSAYDAYRGRLDRVVERTEGRARTVADYREILADSSVDAVLIGSPDHWHARQCIEAVEAGKDVYCEKPLTYSISEGRKIAAAVEKAQRVLQVGSQNISSDLQQTAREMVQAGKIGRVTMVRAAYNRNSASGAWIYPIPPDASPETVDWDTFLGSAPKRPFDLERFFRWRCYEDYSGGIATDLFVHLATTIHFVMNAKAPSEVTAFGELYRWGDSRDVPDTLNAILRYPEGFTVTLSSTFNNATGGTGFEFLGTEGSIAFNRDTMTVTPETTWEGNGWIVESWPSELQQRYYDEHPEERGRPPRPPEPKEFTEQGPDATVKHLAAFVAAVRSRKTPVEDVWAGHRAAGVAHLVNRSAKTGEIARWDPKKDDQS